MGEAVFRSAGVPDLKREAEYAATADPVAITAAVSALVHATFGRRCLVWGGHPAITPMICAVAEEAEIEYSQRIQLYQSNFFKEEFPEDNARFQKFTYGDGTKWDREQSLRAMHVKIHQPYVQGSSLYRRHGRDHRRG